MDGLPILTSTKMWRDTAYTASMVLLSLLFNPELYARVPITHFPRLILILLKFASIYHVLNWRIAILFFGVIPLNLVASSSLRRAYIWTPLLTIRL